MFEGQSPEVDLPGAIPADPPPGAAWREQGLIDDVRPMLFAARARGEPAALATIVAADGGPRPVGSQMLVDASQSWGFLSGGCVEDDVVRHARKALIDGAPVRLIYGRASPFIDMRLPCGGQIEVLVEIISPEDPAVGELQRLWHARLAGRWSSDGRTRRCAPLGGAVMAPGADAVAIRYDPPWRLRVIGEDPYALAIAAIGTAAGLETSVLAPFASAEPAPLGLDIDRRPLALSLGDLAPDPWTAIVLATHDPDFDDQALARIVGSRAGYIGVLGARRRIPERQRRLREAGYTEDQIERVHMPLGLSIGARSPFEVAVSAIAQIMTVRHAQLR